MRARPALALTSLLTLLAAAARADAPPSEVKPAEPPHEEFHPEPAHEAPAPSPVHEARPIPDEPGWQLGAGLGLGSSNVVSNNTGGLSGLSPSLALALERRLGPATWLGLGAAGTFSHQSGDGTSFVGSTGGDTSGGTKLATDTSAFGASVGLRQVLTPHEPVELSLTASGSLLYGYTVVTTTFSAGSFGTDSSQTAKAKVLTAGLTLGVAAEKPLTDRLALRLALGVLGLSYSRSSIENTNSTDPSSVSTNGNSGFSFGLQPEAALTLRFLF
jgi:hypothetical protein